MNGVFAYDVGVSSEKDGAVSATGPRYCARAGWQERTATAAMIQMRQARLGRVREKVIRILFQDGWDGTQNRQGRRFAGLENHQVTWGAVGSQEQ
ncbi:hypothetical protein GDI0907 [Gluconacetobacter diazotrophicus PA1 5]|uniref:Uncharacterized protein n=1 Tax=Gluconacetobacter diazotrophicus (strain ATCC 49037 / DSM 5601 / CCUG 37298 / CIP 103539 / LMG 7603 / PAl5) TaxID=272568 RepID=A9HBS2_GLUDA|nr:hypothetical protein GDI0907 [Gluconacetobacter diazotrophicus PA1 5]